MKYYDKENPLVLHCDNHILIADKPAGVPTQGGLDSELKEWIKQAFQKPGNVFLETIHRLDKPVSGLVLFARTSKALSRLQEQMRGREIEKTYYALVERAPNQKEGTLEHFLVHDEFHARVVGEAEEGAKRAVLHYRTLGTKDGLTLLEVELVTGRYHQIRAQLSAIGSPILGDAKYGSQKSFRHEGIALHHGKLGFHHPVTKEKLTFTSYPEWLTPDLRSL